MNIGIVGLGLIGGSMAKATKRRTSHTVYAIDTNEETMLLATICGALDGPLNPETIGACDLLFLAIRPGAAVDWIRAHAEEIAKHTVVVDLCGVKRAVCGQIAPIAREHGFAYIGGHPMAGTERSGFVSSTDDLFAAACMILTPDDSVEITALEELKNFFLDIGFARLTFSTPEEHDRIIAYTSQLAHVTSSAYVRSPESLRQRGFSAGSFRDMTRVARLDEEMWTELFLCNADYLSDQLGVFIGNLREFQEALTARDEEALCALLRAGREMKAKAGEN